MKENPGGAGSEHALMCRYAAGDEAAFPPLFAVVAPRVRAFFYRSFSDGPRTDEMMVETFRGLRRARATFRPELSFRPWLFGIAAGVRRDELRRRYALPATAGERELAEAEERQQTAGIQPIVPMVDHGQNCGVEAARDAIARLPESQR